MKYDGIREGKESSTPCINRSVCILIPNLGWSGFEHIQSLTIGIVIIAIGYSKSWADRKNPL